MKRFMQLCGMTAVTGRNSAGLEYIFLPNDQSNFCVFNLLYKVGSVNESPEHTGLAHLLEHLMFEGSAQLPDFDKALEEAGAENNAFTMADRTNYYIQIPGENLEWAFFAESDRMYRLNLDTDSIQVQKGVVTEEFAQSYLNRPYGDVSHMLRRMAYKDHPYSWPVIGRTPGHITRMPAKTIREFYMHHYQPQNAVLVVAGAFDPQKAKKWCQKYFNGSKVPSSGSGRRSTGAVSMPSPLIPIKKRVQRKVPQDALYLSFRAPGRATEDYLKADLLVALLSEGYSCRFQEVLVRDRQLFTDLDAWLDGSLQPGLLTIGGRLSPGVAIKEAYKAVWEELYRIQKELPGSAEMERTMNVLRTSRIMERMSLSEKAWECAYFHSIGRIEWFWDEWAFYEKIRPGDLRTSARSIFRPEQHVVLEYRSDG